jgi:Pyridoxamine 5'-phosphate oxidase
VPLPDPVARPLRMPKDYGTVGAKRLPWSWASERLGPAIVYWLATLRPDGAPHVRPVDGTWVDNALFVGGSPEAGWIRNLSNDGRVTVHLPDAHGVVILEGEARQVVPDEDLAERLAAAARKYESMYGPSSASSYVGKPVWAIRPERGLGWERFPTDATRWEFESG